MNINPAPLVGNQCAALLNNPDRGFRLEMYMDVHTGLSMWEYEKQDAIQALQAMAAQYQSDHPQLVSLHFYLSHYWNQPLSATALANVQAFFDAAADLGLRVLARFMYTYYDTYGALEQHVINATPEEPSPAQMIEHITQLSPLWHANKTRIHALQAGFIGRLGDWNDGGYAHRYRYNGTRGDYAVLRALLDNTPSAMFIQVRRPDIKNNNLDSTLRSDWRRTGYHNGWLVNDPHVYGLGGDVENSGKWRTVAADSLYAPTDVSMPWGFASGRKGNAVKAEKAATWLRVFHVTSLSLVQNYKEHGGQYDMLAWQQQPAIPEKLESLKLDVCPAWFEGVPQRTLFDYIRDFTGYYLEVVNVRTTHHEVFFKIHNYGTAPPLGITRWVVNGRYTGNMSTAMEPGKDAVVSVLLPRPGSNIPEITLAAYNAAGTPIRFANDVPLRDNGVHVFLNQ